MALSTLKYSDGIYSITARKQFTPIATADIFKAKVFDFAYGMTFGKTGEHRANRSGGQHSRRAGELFADTFQGKMAEYFIYEQFKYYGIKLPEPDLAQWALGKWDSTDLVVNGKKINVKSTKSFGNLLLLETKDWNSNAEYIPNKHTGDALYDFFILSRISPFCSDLMKSQRLLYSDEADRIRLFKLINTDTWCFDIAGWITREELKAAISSRHILPQNACLNTINTTMDAENYYVQAGDMHAFPDLIHILKSR